MTALGYGLVLILVLGLGAVVVSSMQRLAGITEQLYLHPFHVSNAAIGAQASVALIRDQMLELALSPTPDRLAATKTRTGAMDRGLHHRLDIIQAYFLGDPAKVEEIRTHLDQWSRSRESVFAQMDAGQVQQAIDAIRVRGLAQFNRTYTSVEYVVKFAQNRARLLSEEAVEQARAMTRLAVLILAALAVLVGTIGWSMGRRILGVIRQEHSLTAALAESERRFLEAMEIAPIGVALLSPGGALARVNASFVKTLGSTAESLLQRNLLDLTAEPDRDRHRQAFANLAGGHADTYHVELRYCRDDGRLLWAQTHCSLVRDEQGQPAEIVAQVEDISERKASMAQDQFLAAIVENAFDGILTIDQQGIILSFNRAAETIFGYDRGEVIGASVNRLIPEPHASHHDGYIQRYLSTGEKTIIGVGRTVQGLRKSGEVFPMDLAVTELRQDGSVRFTGIVRDITERVKAEDEIRRMAHYDTLTGLPNRLLLQDRLRQCIARAQREGGRLALLFLDLDRFKAINDTLGHDVGDQALKIATERLLRCVRESDTVARLGGDEFVMVLGNIRLIQDAELVAQKILQLMREPFLLQEQPMQISTSVGIAVYPEHGHTQMELFRAADMAMYQAKSSGRATYHVYSGSGPVWRYSAPRGDRWSKLPN